MEHELRDFDDESQRVLEPAPENASSLPPADGGWQAWSFLFASFMVEMLLWGFPFSFGVLQDYYSTHPPISLNPSGVSAVATTCSGIMYLGAIIVFPLCSWKPRQARFFPIYGLIPIVLGIVASSFATKVSHLILTQGVIYGFGGLFLYYPIYVFIDEWFVRRKGFAFGIMWAGSGCGGLSGPLVLNWGLSKYGPAVFLRGWAVAMLLSIGPLLYFVKPRIPPPRPQPTSTTTTPRITLQNYLATYRFLRQPAYLSFSIGNILQGLGYFIPALYLPSFTQRTLLQHAQKADPLTASLTVSILNTATVPGVIALSALSDRLPVTHVVLISAAGSALSVFLLWGFATTLPTLFAFSIVWGFFAGGWTATYAGVLREMRGLDTGYDLGSMIGLLGAGRGVGNVLCGPVSEAILGAGVGAGGGGNTAYATGYGPLIIFTGVTAVLGLTPWVTRRLKLS